ncbi:MAG: ArsR family transcriptional regulator [Acidobacteria bacterium]|nr:MAG: ArsR family transcriptional regulator [Acidobacteriota bacterium]
MKRTARPEQSVALLQDPAQVAAILPALRRRLLESFTGPESAAGLARRLEMPRQKVNYHLRELEKAGLLEMAGERQARGCTERLLRPAARAYLVNPEILGDLASDPDSIQDRFSSSYLIAVAARIIKDVATLRDRARKARRKLATFTLQTDIGFRSPAERTAFADELTTTLARLTAKYHSDAPGARSYRFVVGGHPVITRGRSNS